LCFAGLEIIHLRRVFAYQTTLTDRVSQTLHVVPENSALPSQRPAARQSAFTSNPRLLAAFAGAESISESRL